MEEVVLELLLAVLVVVMALMAFTGLLLVVVLGLATGSAWVAKWLVDGLRNTHRRH